MGEVTTLEGDSRRELLFVDLGTEISVGPVLDGRMMLGTWQSICLVDTNVDNPRRQVRLSWLPG